MFKCWDCNYRDDDSLGCLHKCLSYRCYRFESFSIYLSIYLLSFSLYVCSIIRNVLYVNFICLYAFLDDWYFSTGLSTDQILRQVISFFERDSIEAGELAMEEWFMTLRRIWDCEKWLMKQFSIRDFTFLGFGDFTFLGFGDFLDF